jgi:hypothetical protein
VRSLELDRAVHAWSSDELGADADVSRKTVSLTLSLGVVGDCAKPPGQQHRRCVSPRNPSVVIWVTVPYPAT